MAELERLRDFSRGVDRYHSSIFVGRDAELDELLYRAQAVLNDHNAGRPVGGRISLVTGCPGIGKSSLLYEFAQRESDNFLFVEVGLDHLRSTPDLMDYIRGEALRQQGAKSKLATYGIVAVAQHVRAGDVGDTVKMTSANRLLRSQGVVLMLDEAHSVSPGEKNAGEGLAWRADPAGLRRVVGYQDRTRACRTFGRTPRRERRAAIAVA